MYDSIVQRLSDLGMSLQSIPASQNRRNASAGGATYQLLAFSVIALGLMASGCGEYASMARPTSQPATIVAQPEPGAPPDATLPTLDESLQLSGNYEVGIAEEANQVRANRQSAEPFEGVEFWRFEKSYKFGRVHHHEPWLMVNLSSGAAVIDLRAWPPKTSHWECSVLRDIEPAAEGKGWIAITRTGSTAEDIRFPIWRHPAQTPGESILLSGGETAPQGDHLRGLAIIQNRVFAYNHRGLFELINDKLHGVTGLPKAEGTINVLNSREFTHGFIRRANQSLLLWDGDAYALERGTFRKELELDVVESHEFVSIPWGNAGFHFLADRKLTRVVAGQSPRQVMRGVENIMSIEAGPHDSILFSLGENDRGFTGGLWFPKQDKYIPILPHEVGRELELGSLDSFHYSPTVKRFVFVSRNGVYTIPAKSILKRTPVQL